MTRALGPLWTAEPSRFMGWSRGGALAALAGLAAAVVAAWAGADAGEATGDPVPYAGVVEAMRHGGEFYPAAAGTLRSGGGAAGALAMPPPTLATLAAPLPDPALSALLFALAGAVFMAWVPLLAGALARPAARWGAWLLLAAGLVPYLLPDALFVPEVWAGLFIALSLARWARGARIEAAGWGLCAAVVATAAGAFLLAMLAFAAAGGAKREAGAWGLGLAVLAGTVLSHRRALAGEFGPLAGGERAFGGLEPLAQASAVGALPIALPLLGLAAFGWAAWRGEAGARLVAGVGATAALAAWRPELGGDWGYLVAAPLLAGLAFVPDGLRDLRRAAFPRRRRITVKRVVR